MDRNMDDETQEEIMGGRESKYPAPTIDKDAEPGARLDIVSWSGHHSPAESATEPDSDANRNGFSILRARQFHVRLRESRVASEGVNDKNRAGDSDNC